MSLVVGRHKMKTVVLVNCTVVALALLAPCALLADAEVELESGDGVHRLAPKAFSILPPSIVADLQSRGCSIPQTYGQVEPHNVIRGEFRDPRQEDWAVLCSRERESTILVYWAGSRTDVEELEGPLPDRDWMQGVGDGSMGYSRWIGSVGEAYIVSQYEKYEGPKPPHIGHEGIDQVFTEKGSTVLYWHAGEWLRLTGAD